MTFVPDQTYNIFDDDLDSFEERSPPQSPSVVNKTTNNPPQSPLPAVLPDSSPPSSPPLPPDSSPPSSPPLPPDSPPVVSRGRKRNRGTSRGRGRGGSSSSARRGQPGRGRGRGGRKRRRRNNQPATATVTNNVTRGAQIRWKVDGRKEKRRFPFSGSPGVNIRPYDTSSPLSVLHLFLPDSTIENFVSHTNSYAQLLIDNPAIQEKVANKNRSSHCISSRNKHKNLTIFSVNQKKVFLIGSIVSSLHFKAGN